MKTFSARQVKMTLFALGGVWWMEKKSLVTQAPPYLVLYVTIVFTEIDYNFCVFGCTI